KLNVPVVSLWVSWEKVDGDTPSPQSCPSRPPPCEQCVCARVRPLPILPHTPSGTERGDGGLGSLFPSWRLAAGQSSLALGGVFGVGWATEPDRCRWSGSRKTRDAGLSVDGPFCRGRTGSYSFAHHRPLGSDESPGDNAPSLLPDGASLSSVLRQQYAPSVFEKYTTSLSVGNKEVTLNLYDTAGQEDYDRLRPLSYQNTHLVLICYDVMNPTSYENVLIKWFPEVSHFCRGIPTVLIGCKTDLRKDKEQLRKLRAAQLEPITYNQGESACQQMNAELYLECSAKFRENVENVFREATKIALAALKKAQRQKNRRSCTLL
uniref:Ras homolog family member F, filopodia associated n=1 Tax=Ornithorhynchus anatinus TaxID=9258 RepID=F7DIU2_ORNAN